MAHDMYSHRYSTRTCNHRAGREWCFNASRGARGFVTEVGVGKGLAVTKSGTEESTQPPENPVPGHPFRAPETGKLVVPASRPVEHSWVLMQPRWPPPSLLFGLCWVAGHSESAGKGSEHASG